MNPGASALRFGDMVQYSKTLEYIQNLVANDELKIEINHDINMFNLLKKKHPKSIEWLANKIDYDFGDGIPQSLNLKQ